MKLSTSPSGSFLDFKENGFYELVLIYKLSNQANDTILLPQRSKKGKILNGVSGHGYRNNSKR